MTQIVILSGSQRDEEFLRADIESAPTEGDGGLVRGTPSPPLRGTSDSRCAKRNRKRLNRAPAGEARRADMESGSQMRAAQP